MKVLWLVNGMLPELAKVMGKTSRFVNEGWISGLLNMIKLDDSIKLTLLAKGNRIDKGQGDGFEWILYDASNGEDMVGQFSDILSRLSPDIIHVWGSEYIHSLAMVKAAKRVNLIGKVVVWIQGLISACSLPYNYFAGMPQSKWGTKTFYDCIMNTSMVSQQRAFLSRGVNEMELFNNVNYCIGRTEWDRHFVLSINDSLKYYSCNETLRDDFYTGRWLYKNCQAHSIFVSQASYPLKGFHVLLEALPLVREKYPDVKIYVSGYDIMGYSSVISFLKLKGYGKYLRTLVRKYKIRKNLCFTGRLSAAKMKQYYLNANVFVCCSGLENSSSSVGEAMMLGVPTVVSHVGGIPSIIRCEDETLCYNNNDSISLAEKICRIFELKENISDMVEKAHVHALYNHDRDKNLSRLKEIYRIIYESYK